jgi:P pilus assembly chaperone PapD
MLYSLFNHGSSAAALSNRSIACRGGRLLARLILGALCAVTSVSAWADLMLHPTRLVFDKNERAAQLELINNGKETATYRITLVNRRMNEIGEFSGVDTPLPGEQFSDEMLRYSPRQVVLAPGESQTVRVLLRRPANLQQGEYRSHLQFDRVPDMSSNSIDTIGDKAESDAVGVNLKALIGVSIPVIVRQGDTAATVTLAGPRLLAPETGKAPVLTADLKRTGDRSVYGDLIVTFTPDNGVEHQVGVAGGIAVYMPNDTRKIRMELHPQKGAELKQGTLRMVYRERLEAGGQLLAESAIILP